MRVISVSERRIEERLQVMIDTQAAGGICESRAALREAGRRRYDSMTLPVCGLTVRFRSLPESEFAAFQAASRRRTESGSIELDDEQIQNSAARLIVLCIVDSTGRRILDDDDLPAVLDWDAADSQALYERLKLHLGGAGSTAATESLKKTSNATPGDDSPTVSPLGSASGTCSAG